MNWFIVIFFLGFLIALHELGHYLLARWTGMTVRRYSIGFFKPILSYTSARTGIIYQIGAIPLGGFVEVKGMNPFEEGALEDPDSYQMKAPWKRALVILAGPLANLLIAWFILFAALAMGGLPEPLNEASIGGLVPDSPAQKAGLQIDDQIISINGTPLPDWNTLVDQLKNSPGIEVLLLIDRNGKRLPVAVTPRDDGGVGRIGVFPPTRAVRLPPLQAAGFAARRCGSVLGDTLSGLYGMVTGKVRDVKPVGPPGIVRMARTQLESGTMAFLAFMAYISLMLFLFNLLPIPALDGGRTIFLLYEMVTRRRINKRVDAALNYVFFILLMGLVLIVSLKELIFG